MAEYPYEAEDEQILNKMCNSESFSSIKDQEAHNRLGEGLDGVKHAKTESNIILQTWIQVQFWK